MRTEARTMGWTSRRLVLALLAATALVVAACSAEPPASPGASASPGGASPSAGGNGEAVSIGFIGPMTGEFAVWGQDHFAAAELAADEWNDNSGVLGQQIELVQGDSQGDPTQAASLANQFVDQGIVAVVGPTFSSEAEAAVPIFGQNDIVAVTGLGDLLDPEGSPGYFRTTLREDLSAKYAIRFMREYLEAERIAIVDDGRSDLKRTANLIAEELRAAGVEPVFTGSITPGQQNYSATLTQLRSLEPDVIFLSLVHPEAALVRVQGAELGIETDWVVGAGGAEDAFATVAGDAGVTTYSYQSTRVPDRFAAFSEKYEETYGRPPGNFNDYTYDGANVLFTAIEDAGDVEYAALVEQLEGIEYEGVTGPISFDDTGSRRAEQYEVIAYNEDHEWAVVEDVPFNTAE